MRSCGGSGRAAGPNLPLRPHMIAHRNSNRAQVAVRSCEAIAMIDSNPQAKRAIMVKRIVPVGSYHHTGCRTQYRLKPQVEIVTIMTIVATYAACAVENRIIGPALTIEAHE